MILPPPSDAIDCLQCGTIPAEHELCSVDHVRLRQRINYCGSPDCRELIFNRVRARRELEVRAV